MMFLHEPAVWIDGTVCTSGEEITQLLFNIVAVSWLMICLMKNREVKKLKPNILVKNAEKVLVWNRFISAAEK